MPLHCLLRWLNSISLHIDSYLASIIKVIGLDHDNLTVSGYGLKELIIGMLIFGLGNRELIIEGKGIMPQPGMPCLEALRDLILSHPTSFYLHPMVVCFHQWLDHHLIGVLKVTDFGLQGQTLPPEAFNLCFSIKPLVVLLGSFYLWR